MFLELLVQFWGSNDKVVTVSGDANKKRGVALLTHLFTPQFHQHLPVTRPLGGATHSIPHE